MFGSQRVDGTSPAGNGDERLVALGCLSKTAGTLIRGALGLILAGNCSACSALSRQRVEVKYLAGAFAETMRRPRGGSGAPPSNHGGRQEAR